MTRAAPTARSGADGTEQVGPFVADIAGRARARDDAGPHPGQGALLTDPGLVLEPELDRLAIGGGGQRLFHYGGEVFLKACCAASSVCGWRGHTDRRVNLSCPRIRPTWRSERSTTPGA